MSKRPSQLVEEYERSRRQASRERTTQQRAVAAGFATNYLEKHLYPELKEWLWGQLKEAHGDAVTLASVAATSEALDAIMEMTRSDARKLKKHQQQQEEPKDV